MDFENVLGWTLRMCWVFLMDFELLCWMHIYYILAWEWTLKVYWNVLQKSFGVHTIVATCGLGQRITVPMVLVGHMGPGGWRQIMAWWVGHGGCCFADAYVISLALAVGLGGCGGCPLRESRSVEARASLDQTRKVYV